LVVDIRVVGEVLRIEGDDDVITISSLLRRMIRRAQQQQQHYIKVNRSLHSFDIF